MAKKKKLSNWVRKFIRYGLMIAIIAFILWWLLNLIGDMQATIISLQEHTNQQNLQIQELQGQLEMSLQNNTQLKVRINGLTEYIFDQNNVINDLKDQLNQPTSHAVPRFEIEEPESIESKEPSISPADVGKVGSIPIIVGALTIVKKLILPKGMIMGGI